METKLDSSLLRKSRFRREATGIAILVFGLVGCSDISKDPEGSQSASEFGIGRPPTGIDSVPGVILGTAFGSADEAFSGDIDATVLSDGRLVVADGGARQLKFFGEEGNLLMVAGGKGGGPGEFSFLSQVASGGGDTVFAGDWRQVSRYSPAGTFLDRTELDHVEVQRHLPPGQVRSGIELLGEAGFVFISTAGSPDPAGLQGASPATNRGGVVRFPTAYQFASLDLQSWEPYGGGLGPESISPESMRDNQVPGIIPFLAQTVYAPSRDGRFLVLGDSRSGSIDVYSRGGRIEVSFTHFVERTPLTRSQRRAWVEYFLPSQYRVEEIERNWAGIDLPEEMPAFGGIRMDTEGYIWVLDYDWPRSGKKRVVCYNPSGNLVGEFFLDGVSEVLEVGDNHLIGLGFDEFEVPSLLVFSVTRGPQ